MPKEFLSCCDPAHGKRLTALGVDVLERNSMRNLLVPWRIKWDSMHPTPPHCLFHETEYVDAIVEYDLYLRVNGNTALITPEMVAVAYEAQFFNIKLRAFLDDLYARPDSYSSSRR